MKDLLNVPARDVQPTKNKSLPVNPGRDLITKGDVQNKGIDPSELFSYFTANIINEKKVFTR